MSMEGSFENRIRFLLEVIDAVNEVWPAESRCLYVYQLLSGRKARGR
jgi:2,4-dienoyl-CoA reductase-like NADH-dependent reductase (Old Yellow Enzyme family)